jgi:hypothetical protein
MEVSTVTTTIPQAELAERVRLANCPHCWQRPGRSCTITGPAGDHLARWQRAERRGLIGARGPDGRRRRARGHRRARPHPGRCGMKYDEIDLMPLTDVLNRYQALNDRDSMARSIAKLQARGEWKVDGSIRPEDYPPLTTAEQLELLALGERLARYYRHPSSCIMR